MRDETQFLRLWNYAYAAGCDAANSLTIAPMYVRDGSGNVYTVPGGPCGFAWVNVKPGNSAFAKWLVKTGRARKDTYYGGVTIWISEYGQSMEAKYAHAAAMVKELTAEGIRCYAASRMD